MISLRLVTNGLLVGAMGMVALNHVVLAHRLNRLEGRVERLEGQALAIGRKAGLCRACPTGWQRGTAGDDVVCIRTPYDRLVAGTPR